MTRKVLIVVAAGSIVAILLLMLRRDLALLYWQQGRHAYADGNYRGALALFERAQVVLPREASLLVDAGGTLYRLGRFKEARAAFAVAASASEGAARCAAFFNGANCAFRLAEMAALRDPRGAVALLREAAQGYRDVLRREPTAADAAHNIALVHDRLAGLSRREEESAAVRVGKGATATRRQRPSDGNSTTQQRPPERGSAGNAAASAGREGAEGPGGQGRGRRGKELTVGQADRLLSEERARETAGGTPPTHGTKGQPARPDKDW